MALLNEKIVLDFYLQQINEDKIMFLKGRDAYKKEIAESITALREEANMHGRIQHAKALWKQLFEASMSFISRDKRGYDDLFSYFDEYVNFEELIFASDAFYRDHTLHCLWVYFLGEYIKRHEDFRETFDSGESQGVNVIARIRDIFENSSNNKYFKETVQILNDVIKLLYNEESTRCITSLTHDLGYPIKKIGKINKSIKSILPYYAINNYDEFNFDYTVIQQNYINDFLQLMGDKLSVNLISGERMREHQEFCDKVLKLQNDLDNPIILNDDEIAKLTAEDIKKLQYITTPEIKVIKSITNHARYSNDFEQYEHGVMSAFLLMRTINSFNMVNYSYTTRTDINPNQIDTCRVATMQNILRSITDHTSPKYQMNETNGWSEFLILMDELEEFSRISRANQNRQYVSEFCKTDIYMEDGRFNVDFIFDNENFDGIDPEKAFKGKCRRFLNLFDIPNLRDSVRIRIRCIGRLPYDINVYSLEIAKHYANITVNDEEQNIPKYLKSKVFYTKEEYMANI